jgi:hypothetical protein
MNAGGYVVICLVAFVIPVIAVDAAMQIVGIGLAVILAVIFIIIAVCVAAFGGGCEAYPIALALIGGVVVGFMQAAGIIKLL